MFYVHLFLKAMYRKKRFTLYFPKSAYTYIHLAVEAAESHIASYVKNRLDKCTEEENTGRNETLRL